MGCDIHAFIEYRWREEAERRDEWSAFHGEQLSLGRHYGLFRALAGVRKSEGDRDELIPARGFPEDASYEAFRGLYFPVFDEVPEGFDFLPICYELRAELRATAVVVRKFGLDYVLDGQVHTPSWLTYEEIGRCLAHSGVAMEEVDIWFQAAYAAMGKLEEYCDTRLVFWFDN